MAFIHIFYNTEDSKHITEEWVQFHFVYYILVTVYINKKQ